MDDIKVEDDEVEYLLANIMEDVFQHDKNNDGLDFQEFKTMVANRPRPDNSDEDQLEIIPSEQ